MNIIEDSNAGGRLGAALGSGIQLLAQQKLNQIAQRQQRAQSNKAFEALGFSPEEASAVSNLPTKLQEKFVLGYLERGGGLQGLQQSQPAPQQQSFQPQQNNSLQQLMQGQKPRGQMPNYGKSPVSADDAVNKLLLRSAAPSGQEEQALAPLGAPRTNNKILPQAAPTVLQQKPQAQVAPQQQAQQQVPIEQQAPQRRSIAEVFAQQKESKPTDIKLSKTQEAYEKAYYANEEIEHTAQEMKDLLKSGKVASGWLAKQLPIEFQNAETQRFDQLSKKIVAYEVSKLGIPTNAKIKFSESAKVNLGQDPKVQEKGIDTIIKEAASKKEVAKQRLPQGYFGEDAPQELVVKEEVSEKKSPLVTENKEKEAVEPQGESWADWLGNKVSGVADSVVRNVNRVRSEGIGSLDPLGLTPSEEENDKWLSSLTGGKSDLSPQQKTDLKKWSDDNREYYKPQNFSEEVFDSVVKNLPFVALTGAGALGKAFTADVAGTVASKGVEKAGGGPVAQILAGVAGGSAANRISNALKKGAPIKNLTSIAKEAESQAYAKADKIGSGIKVDGKDYQNSLDKLYGKVEDTTKIPAEERKELLSKLRRWSTDVEMGKISPSKIIERKQDINSLYGSNKSKAFRDYLREAQSIMFNKAEDIGKSHPEWIKAWKEGDRIHGALNYQPEFMKIIEDYPKVAKAIKSPVASILLGAGYGIYKGSLKPVAYGLALPAGQAAAKKALQVSMFALNKDPNLRKVALEAFKAVAERNIPQAARSFARVNQIASKYDDMI